MSRSTHINSEYASIIIQFQTVYFCISKLKITKMTNRITRQNLNSELTAEMTSLNSPGPQTGTIISFPINIHDIYIVGTLKIFS